MKKVKKPIGMSAKDWKDRRRKAHKLTANTANKDSCYSVGYGNPIGGKSYLYCKDGRVWGRFPQGKDLDISLYTDRIPIGHYSEKKVIGSDGLITYERELLLSEREHIDLVRFSKIIGVSVLELHKRIDRQLTRDKRFSL